MRKYISLFLVIIMISTLCSCNLKSKNKAYKVKLDNNCSIVVEPNIVLLEILDYLNDKIINKHYPTLDLYINDLLTRAAAGRLIRTIYGDEKYKTYIDYQKKYGFIYIDEVSKGFEEYENNRDKYPIFKEFYPRMLEILKETSEKKSDVKK